MEPIIQAKAKEIQLSTLKQNSVNPKSDERINTNQELAKVAGVGHNRYKICTENDIPFKTIAKSFSDRSEAVEWIIQNQFGRRNLSLFDRGVLALRLKPILEEKAKQRRESTLKQNASDMTNWSEREQGTTRKALAEISGTSEGTIARVETIVTKGTPEQIQRVREGGKEGTIPQ